MDEQREQVNRVLSELEVRETPVLEVMNKTDLVSREALEGLKESGAIMVSGLRRTGIEALLQAIDASLTQDPLLEVRFRLPQSEGRAMAAIEAGATVEQKRFEGNLAYLVAIGPASLLNRYRRFQLRDSPAGTA